MERSDWPDPRLDRLESRINGIPEMVATHTIEIKELRDDVRAIRKLLEAESEARAKATESIRDLIDSQTAKSEAGKSMRVVAFIGATGVILASLLSSAALLVTQL